MICADAEAVAADLVQPGDAVFADPARRNEHGRVWRVEDFTPRWSLITGLLDGSRIAGVKLGPALPPAFIPATAEAEWLTHRGDTVEVCLWAGPGAEPGRRSALVLPDARLIARDAEPLDVGPLGAYLYEPDGAVIRAGGVAQLGADLKAHLLDPHLAYLTGDRSRPDPLRHGVPGPRPAAVRGQGAAGLGEGPRRRSARDQEAGHRRRPRRAAQASPAGRVRERHAGDLPHPARRAGRGRRAGDYAPS